MQSVASTMPLMKFMQTINLSVFNQGAHYSMKFLLQLLLNLQLLWTFCTDVIQDSKVIVEFLTITEVIAKTQLLSSYLPLDSTLNNLTND